MQFSNDWATKIKPVGSISSRLKTHFAETSSWLDSQDISHFRGTSLLIIPFKRLRHWPEPVESVCTLLPIGFRHILILSSYLRRGFTNGLFPSDFLTIPLFISFVFFMYAKDPHLLLSFIKSPKYFTENKIFKVIIMPCSRSFCHACKPHYCRKLNLFSPLLSETIYHTHSPKFVLNKSSLLWQI
jgi:hypothetical protein